MKKLLNLIAAVVKALAPVAGDLTKSALSVGGKLAGKAGGAAAKSLRRKLKLRTFGLRHKTRKFLRTAAVISGLVCALSFTTLLLTHRK